MDERMEDKIAQLTFREYYRINKHAFKLIFKRLGVIFTSILALVFIIVGVHFKTIMDGIYLFLFCFGIGNFLALSFSSFILATQYSKANSQIRFISKFPSEIRAAMGLKLGIKPPESPSSFLELAIIGFDNNSFVYFDYNKDEQLVWITVHNVMNDISDFNATKVYIDKKYRDNSIFLSGIGLKKEIKWKQWLKMTEKDIKKQIVELYAISERENLRIFKVYEKIKWV